MDEFGIDWDVEDGPGFDSGSGFEDVGVEPIAEFDFDLFEEAPEEAPEALLDGYAMEPEAVEGAYELLGADPDEEELWNQLMLDLNDEVSPYPPSLFSA